MVLSTIGHGQGGNQEYDVDDDLPHDRVLGQVVGIDEALQQVNRRNADDGRRKLDLEHAGIDVRQPFRLVGWPSRSRRETKVS
jgi:hypothetical protein